MRSQRALIALRNLRRPQCRSVHRRWEDVSFRGRATQAQDHPVDDVVNNQLNKPLDDVQTTTDEVPTNVTDASTRQSQRDEVVAKAQIVFGSKLVGPQRQAQLDAKSRLVAGVLVPPRPEEPDNCCMSGCVNCVWDMYRDEMEDWMAKSTEARARLEAQKITAPTPALPDNKMPSSDLAVSMDDDGGGSESNWTDEGPVSGDMFEGIPVGIRAFMENEKRLKAKHRSESAANV